MISEDDWLKMRRQAQLLLELDFSDQAIAITKVPSVQTLAIPIKLEGLFYLKEVFIEDSCRCIVIFLVRLVTFPGYAT